MRREVTLEEISDGRLYEANDMVKADCQDCKGCFDCCTGMGDSVVLDPLDVWRLSQGLGLSVDQLLAAKYEADEISAAKCVVLSTLFSIIAIPVWSVILLAGIK